MGTDREKKYKRNGYGGVMCWDIQSFSVYSFL